MPLVSRAAERAPKAQFIVQDLAQGTGLPDSSVDGVGFFDVLEHLDDPKGALHEAVRTCRAGGIIVGTVPALPCLWSRVDEASGHRLRYTESTLRELLSSIEGIEIEEITFFNCALVPMIWLQRQSVMRQADDSRMMEANLKTPPRWINGILNACLRLEEWSSPLLHRLKIPGASLYFCIRKQAGKA
jgi:SAM-dependent methyltransferase